MPRRLRHFASNFDRAGGSAADFSGPCEIFRATTPDER
jgi:hypothetical protein